MGVNFQNNAQYREAKRFYVDNKVGVGTAQGIHSKNGYWGMMIIQLLPQLLMGGVGLLTNSSSSSNKSLDVEATSSTISKFSDYAAKFRDATGEEKKELAKKIKEIAEDNPNISTIAKYWQNISADVNKLIS